MYLIAKKFKRTVFVINHCKKQWVRQKYKRAKPLLFDTLQCAEEWLSKMGIDKEGSYIIPS